MRGAAILPPSASLRASRPGILDYSVVIPAFDEAPSLEELHREVCAVLGELGGEFELIFVDDGSTDATPAILARLAATDPRVIPVRLDPRGGKAAAYARGFAAARGALIITLDADLQDDPRALPSLVGAIAQGHDLVIAHRRNRAQHEPIKTLASAAFNLSASVLIGPRLHDINCGFRVFRRAVLSAFDLRPGFHRFLPSQAHRAGFRVTELSVLHRPRKYGASKYSYARAFVGLWGLWAMYRRG